jgi:type IV secretory pathway TraG/TraD family ATPase VirD4
MLVAALAIASALGLLLLGTEDNRICNYAELSDIRGNGISLSKNVRLSVQQSNEHVLMVAPSGAGKTRRFIMPNINRLKNCSLVVTDPCGEIERSCKANRKTYILNPFSADSIGYDPLKLCKNEFEVKKIADVILKNGAVKSGDGKQDEFIQMAKPLLTAYMLFNYNTKKYSFGEMIKNICTKPILHEEEDCICSEIVESDVESAITELDIFMQVYGSAATLSSIRIVMNGCLQSFLDENLQAIFEKPCINFSKLREEESIVYIQIPERHCSYYAPLTATFLTQIIDSLLENSSGLQTYMLFDEFTNIGIIPDMCQLLATARKRSISIVAAIQSLTQLHRVYGETEGKELRELFKSLLVCAGLRDSAEYISNILGYKTEKDKTKPLMSPDEIRRMSKDEVLIICNNKRPVKDEILAGAE